jgi:hypothetical protein
LGDEHNDNQVVEQLKRADHALLWLLAVRARRLPQVATQPIPPRAALLRAGYARRGVPMPCDAPFSQG